MKYITRIALVTLLTAPVFVLAQYEFTPLTNLPGLGTVTNSDTLPAFLNNLYRLCIGAAAVIAILQIMRAGVQYFMFNKGSVAHNEKGKAMIGNALLGLLLVLSPAIVFGIINPDILNLRLDIGSLRPPPDPTATIAVYVKSNATEPIDANDFASADDQQRAQALQSACVAQNGTIRIGVSTATTRCPADAEGTANCRVGTVRCELPNALMDSVSQAACNVSYQNISAIPGGQQCTNGTMAIPYSCCQGSAPGTTCCGKTRTTNTTQPTATTTPQATTTPVSTAVQEYQWRYKFLNAVQGNGGTQKSAVFASAQACRANLTAYLEARPGWSSDPNQPTNEICSCDAPRSTFAMCRN